MNDNPPRSGLRVTAAVFLFVYGISTLIWQLSCGAWTLESRDFALNRELENELPSLHGIRVTTLLFGSVLSVSAILCGVAVVQGRSWARIAANFVCMADLVITTTRRAYDEFVVLPACKPILARMALNNPRVGQMDPFFMGIEALVHFLMVLVFCSFVLIFVNVAVAFAGKASPESSQDVDREILDDFDTPDPESPKPRFPGDTGIRT